jgi:hypothetical protein
MNTRIIELAKQAGLSLVGDFGWKQWVGPRWDAMSEKDLEKFAELIVRECAEQVKNLRVNDYGISGAEIISEHFGVEE